MLRALIHRILDSEEKKLGESVDYIRHVVDTSPGAFFRFAAVMPMANARKVLPVDAWFVAQTVASQDEDCGTCLQITLNLARKARVAPEVLRAVVEGRADDLPDDMADIYRFTAGVVASNGEDDALRETLRRRYGDRGLIELAYAIASARVPPIVKRTLGYAKSCSLMRVNV